MGLFTEEKIVTTTTLKIKEVINGNLPLPSDAAVSVVPAKYDGGIYLVVGANYKAKYKSYFSKKSLKVLIDELQKVHDTMKDTY
jgi:hypothetical protein